MKLLTVRQAKAKLFSVGRGRNEFYVSSDNVPGWRYCKFHIKKNVNIKQDQTVNGFNRNINFQSCFIYMQ